MSELRSTPVTFLFNDIEGFMNPYHNQFEIMFVSPYTDGQILKG